MKIILNEQELSALTGLPRLAQCLYVFGIKPRIDWATGIAGVKRRISWQSLREELYVEPHPGIKSGSPSKNQLRRAVQWLEKTGLVHSESCDHQLIFRCLLAKQDYYDLNKQDIKPTEHADTFPTNKNTRQQDTLKSNEDTTRQVEIDQPDIPLKVKNSNDITPPDLMDDRYVPVLAMEWVCFFAKVMHFPLPIAYTAKTATMFEGWCEMRYPIGFIKTAIGTAEATLGQKPKSPMFYQKFVATLQKAKPKTQERGSKHGEYNKSTPQHRSAAARMWESCRGGL